MNNEHSALNEVKLPKRIKSQWSGHTDRVVPRLLSRQFGDGKKLVTLSFYAAPELCVVVPFDSGLPLDLNDEERFKDSVEVRSFRDRLDEIYDILEEQFVEPPVGRYRRAELRKEIEDEDEDELSLWSLIFAHGSTWCHYPK